MVSSVSAALRKAVIQQADSKCEYCKLSQSASIYTHEVDHLVAVKHDGQTVLENLALTCLHCNRHKGSDLTTFDPTSRDLVRLFNSRHQLPLARAQTPEPISFHTELSRHLSIRYNQTRTNKLLNVKT